MLEITKYSILGWSDGGITGMIMAAKFPQEVTKLAIWGANSFILPTELQIYDKIKDIRTWSPKMKQPMIEVYGEDAFSKLWAAWVEGVKNLYHEKKGNICREMLKDIKCPTLILHGEKDPMVEESHVSHLLTNIDGS
ncbi:Valacyclovir hydrolase, partial [Eumeta japonica]